MFIWGVMAFKFNGDAGHLVMLDMQLGISLHCEMYSLPLHYKTCKNIEIIFIDPYFKDNMIFGLLFMSYAINTYILNS